MYFELKAKDLRSFRLAVWEADMSGLDPEYDEKSLTFNIGTGNIEKVSRIRDKYKLKETYISEYEKLMVDYHLVNDISVNINKSNTVNYQLVAKNQITQMISLLKQPDAPVELINSLVKHCQQWDQLYKLDALTIYPEFKDIFNEHGYV